MKKILGSIFVQVMSERHAEVIALHHSHRIILAVFSGIGAADKANALAEQMRQLLEADES